MTTVELLFRWMHMLGAVTLVGGAIFMRFAWLAPLQTSAESAQLAAAVRRKWARLVMVSSGLLLLSGLVNLPLILTRYDLVADDWPGRLYHPLFGVKFLLALAVFFLAAALSGRSKLAERLREKEQFWLSVTVLLAVAVVLLGGVLKLADRQEKSATSSRPAAAARTLAG